MVCTYSSTLLHAIFLYSMENTICYLYASVLVSKERHVLCASVRCSMTKLYEWYDVCLLSDVVFVAYFLARRKVFIIIQFSGVRHCCTRNFDLVFMLL